MATVKSRITILCLLAMLLAMATPAAAASPKMKYPGGKFYIWRYTLKDKQGSPYSLDHPSRWLSHKSVERRRRQGLALDSTDLPVSPQYLKSFEREATEASHKKQKPATEWAMIGTSRWQNMS